MFPLLFFFEIEISPELPLQVRVALSDPPPSHLSSPQFIANYAQPSSADRVIPFAVPASVLRRRPGARAAEMP
jgi:hypothetical protein